MGQPGKIAFPVIIVLGAITGYITYTLFTAAIPDEGTFDSPYYQPIPPGSEENEPGNTGGGGGAAQQGGGGGAAQQGGGGAGGGPTLTILEGSAVQGNPDYDPDELTAAAGSDVNVVNEDTVPHTVTSGASPTDPNAGQTFDTSIINGGESATLSLAQVAAGSYDYHCMVHPYMTGELVVQ
ncbi:MAG TPA: cupredoxin domain-containing protein [Nitrososphaera sp.]|nr:cupredoxin domain-containing protein [Nitrososphaera sp.]